MSSPKITPASPYLHDQVEFKECNLGLGVGGVGLGSLN